jgi:hypothetical protein
MKSYLAVEVNLHAFLTAALGGYKQSDSFSAHCDDLPANTKFFIFDKVLLT